MTVANLTGGTQGSLRIYNVTRISPPCVEGRVKWEGLAAPRQLGWVSVLPSALQLENKYAGMGTPMPTATSPFYIRCLGAPRSSASPVQSGSFWDQRQRQVSFSFQSMLPWVDGGKQAPLRVQRLMGAGQAF